MLINSKLWREENILNKLLENAKKYFSELKFFDLDLLNLTTTKIKALDFKYCILQSLYYFDYKKAQEYTYLKEIYTDEQLKTIPAIIHYAGQLGKPWRMKKPYSDYQEYIDRLPKELKKYTLRDLRKRIFNVR